MCCKFNRVKKCLVSYIFQVISDVLLIKGNKLI